MNAFSRSNAAGILYAEDFGELPPPGAPRPPPRHPSWPPAAMPGAVPNSAPESGPKSPPVPPPLTQADIEAACIRAVQAAERAWSEGAAERRAAALEIIGTRLDEALAEAKQQAEALADGLARTFLGMAATALPALCRRHGDAEVLALLHRILPLAAGSGGVVVRVHAGLIETLAVDLALLDDSLADRVQLRAANLPAGDVRITWENGGLVRDTGAIHAAMQDCLLQLGLLDPVPVSAPAPILAAAIAPNPPQPTQSATRSPALAH
ncbi:MAG: hypothetical protein ACRYGM_03835 [Janthinobacterium lividum]